MPSSRLSALPTLALALALLCAAPAWAELRLEISGGDEALRNNISAHIGPLPEPEALSRAWLRQARRTAREGAEALGYYNAKITLRRREEDGDTVLRVQLDPGPRVELRRVEIVVRGEASADRAFTALRQSSPLQPGVALDHGRYEAVKRSLQNLALVRGYFDAEFVRSRVEVDAVDNVADVELIFDSGPRYAFGPVNFAETPFREQLLARLVPFERGEPYDAEEVIELNRRLLDSRYFQDVRVRPEPERAEDREVPIEVGLTPQLKNRLGIGLGYSTDVGPRLRLSWTKPWINSRGHSLSSALELAESRQQLTAQYQIPLRDPLSDFLQLQTGYLNESFEDTESERLTLSVQRLQKLSGGWQRGVYVRLDREHYEQAAESGQVTLVLPGVSFTRTRSRGGIDPNWGDRLLATAEVTDPVVGSDLRLGRLRIGGRWLRSLGERHQVYLRLDAGGNWTDDFEDVPPSLRFYAGGDQSVRGFGYNTLSPEAANGDLIGGRYLLTGTVEYGFTVHPSWRLSTFIDAGNAFDDIDERFKVGTGFGVAWISPVGPIRLDLAWGVSEDDPPFRVHFTMGPRL